MTQRWIKLTFWGGILLLCAGCADLRLTVHMDEDGGGRWELAVFTDPTVVGEENSSAAFADAHAGERQTDPQSDIEAFTDAREIEGETYFALGAIIPEEAAWNDLRAALERLGYLLPTAPNGDPLLDVTPLIDNLSLFPRATHTPSLFETVYRLTFPRFTPADAFMDEVAEISTGLQTADVLTMRYEIELPGTYNTPTGQRTEDGTLAWTVDFSRQLLLPVAAESSTTNVTLIGGVIMLFSLLVIGILFFSARANLEKRRPHPPTERC